MANPWTAFTAEPHSKARLKSAPINIPRRGTHFLSVRGHLMDPQGRPEGMPETVSGLRDLMSGDLAPLDAAFGPGMAAATGLLAEDPRLKLDCVVALLGAHTPVTRRNRAQALREFPLLVVILAMQKQPSTHMKFLPDDIASAVDEGRPLVRTLVDLFKAPAWVIRHLRGLVEDEVDPYTSFGELAQHVGALIPERAPAKRGYFLLAYLSSSELRRYPWIAAAARRSVIAAGWPELGTRVARMAQFMDYAGFVEALAGRSGNIDAALGEPTLAQIEKLSHRWHEIENGIRQRLAPAGLTYDRAAQSWLPLLPQPVQAEGYEVKSLSDRAALEAESLALRHCVAGYADRCAAGLSHIVSITRGGQNVATAELSVKTLDERRSLQLKQASGERNSRPEPGALRALQRVIDAIPQDVLAALPEPDASSLEGANRAPGRLFEETLAPLGDEALALYRPCLQVSRSKTGLWEIVCRRFARQTAASSVALAAGRPFPAPSS